MRACRLAVRRWFRVATGMSIFRDRLLRGLFGNGIASATTKRREGRTRKWLSVVRRICIGLVLSGLCGSTRAGVLPQARRFSDAWRHAGYPGEIPAPDTIVNVRDVGAVGDGSQDDAPAVAAANCWVRGVASYNTFCGHVALVYSTQCEVTRCCLHHAHYYGGGGAFRPMLDRLETCAKMPT